ncbi:unnamed protein product [Phaeothamnion confervicola]
MADMEKLEIASNLLNSSPPGQFGHVLADVKQLLPTGLIDDDWVCSVARSYNALGWRSIDVDDHRFVPAAEAQVGPAHCIDTKAAGCLVAVDHITAATLPDSQAPLPPPLPPADDATVNAALEPLRAAAEAAVDAYRKTQFRPGRSASSVFASGGRLVIYVNSEHLNLRNWWGGAWASRYELAPAANGGTWNGGSGGGGAWVLQGKMRVHLHYFEDGNMQLQSTKALPPTDITAEDDEGVAMAMAAAIKAAEDALHAALEEMYTTVEESTLRSLRRPKTIVATKFGWNIHEVRMRARLGQANKGN